MRDLSCADTRIYLGIEVRRVHCLGRGKEDGIAAFCKPENKLSFGFVESLNRKIRAIQRRAYGLKDEEYLRLKFSPACSLRSEKHEKLPTRFYKAPD